MNIETQELNENHYIHGMPINFSNLKSVFEHGIVSKKRASELGIKLKRHWQSHIMGSHDEVSVIDPYAKTDARCEAFAKNAFSFLIDKNAVDEIKHSHSIPDFIKGKLFSIYGNEQRVPSIPPEMIIGVMIPKQHKDTKMNEFEKFEAGPDLELTLLEFVEKYTPLDKSISYTPDKLFIEKHLRKEVDRSED